MAALQDAQLETMATIDAAKVLVDKVLSILQLVTISPSLSLTFATNPIGFLLQMLEHLGVTYEDLRGFLSDFLIYVIPVLEISVKAILLTNLKNMITCTTDPRIPEKYRKQHKATDDPNSSQEYGIDIGLEAIDFFNKLSISPLSDEGKNWYFGLSGVTDVYKFARADDFDAFLWFVMHKGKFPNSSQITDMSTFTDNIHGGGASSVEGNSLLEVVNVHFNGDKKSSILPGNTFTYEGSSHVISMCIDSAYDNDNKIVANTLVPTSDDWNSVNWYARRANYLTKNMGIESGTSRDYNKEIGICNLQFLDQASSESPLNGLVNNKFRFTILPKPLVHIPDIGKGEPPWRFKKMLFNSKGEYDPNGKYTIASASETYTDGDKFIRFWSNNVELFKLDLKSGSIYDVKKDEVIKNLMECYKGLTVFEFNYDYVMSLKLFDAKALATSLLDSLVNMRLGLNISMQHQADTEEIKTIIKNIVESDDIEIDDCFFEFKNDKYDALLKRAEEKKAKKVDFSNVRKILDEYDDAAELNEQVDIINRAITQASVNVAAGVEGKDEFKVRFDFVTDLIEQLTFAIVEGLLSPKVLMLLEVNETIMGGKWEKFTIKDLLKAMRSIIVAVIKEIRDLIIQELLKLLLKLLSPIIATLSASILREQIEAYTELIDDIIRNCPKIWWLNTNTSYSDTILDTVDYADIDNSETINNEPITNSC